MFVEYRHVFPSFFGGKGVGGWYGLGGGRWGDRVTLTSHQQLGHTKTNPRFKASSKRLEKWGINLATPGLVSLGWVGRWEGRVGGREQLL